MRGQPVASYNDPTLGIYVIVKGIINKYTRFSYLNLYIMLIIIIKNINPFLHLHL
jgi:hypothetical protein